MMDNTDTDSDKLFNPKPQTIDFEGYTLNDELPTDSPTPAQVLLCWRFWRNLFQKYLLLCYKAVL